MNRTIIKNIDDLKPRIDDFCHKLSGIKESPKKGIVGFDGFIDTMIRFSSPSTMAEFGPMVTKAAGIAASAQVKCQGQQFGGNGPLMAVALRNLFDSKLDYHYFGALGVPTVLPIFSKTFGSTESLHSFANPATSECLEFSDGKIMLSDMDNCEEVSWENMVEKVGMTQIHSILRESDFVAAVNWGKITPATTLWRNIVKTIEDLGKSGKKNDLLYGPRGI